MSIEIKNILTVPEIEEPTGEENLLVESNGAFKRLPSSNFSGGSGSGFDVTAWVTTELTAREGYAIVDLGDVVDETSYGATSSDPDHPTPETVFANVAGFNSETTTNIYKAHVTITAQDMSSDVYAYYNSGEWKFTNAEGVPSNYVEASWIASVQTDLTFDELFEAANQRCLSVLIGTPIQRETGVVNTTAQLHTIQLFSATVAAEAASEIGVTPDGGMLYCMGKINLMESSDTDVVLCLFNIDNELNSFVHMGH